MSLAERFASYFRAVNDGEDPYPWQQELVRTVATSGSWPRGIAAPTGSGKSSVIDVHAFLVAEHVAGRVAARPPRRLVLVAPRRVLVDDQHERATAIADELARLLRGGVMTDDERVACDVASSLASLLPPGSADDDPAEGRRTPLLVTRLRGGAAIDDRWRLDPARCQVICATPQMWGSRLLLRGFRSSRRARNLESGLIAHDVVAVIDEAHLHERLAESAGRSAHLEPGRLRLQVVAMSATRPDAGALSVTADDLADDRLRRRVRARKTIEIDEVPRWPEGAADALVEAARVLSADGTVGVFVNTVGAALDVTTALRRDGATVAMVCGRMRPADLARLRRDRPGLLDARGDDEVDFLVATQSLEVGVDLDLPAMVTALAPAASLAQRAGRLNRSGRYDRAVLRVVCPADIEAAKDGDLLPYAKSELQDARRWLDALDGDAGPLAVAESALPRTRRPVLPPLTRTERQTAAMTSEQLGADVDVSFYVDEPRDRDDHAVSIAARGHLDLPGTVVEAALLAAPPRAHELATVALGSELDKLLSMVMVDDAGDASRVWVMRRDAGVLSATPRRDPERLDLRPGDVLVVAAGSRILTERAIGVARGRSTAGDVIDDVMSERPEGVAGPARPDVALPIPEEDLVEVLSQDGSLSTRRSRRALSRVLVSKGMATSDLTRRLERLRLAEIEVRWCPDLEGDGGGTGLLVLVDRTGSGRPPRTATTDEAVPLDAHEHDVRRRLEDVLDRLRTDALDEERGSLLAAAALHDEGKRHPRFQRRMGVEAVGDREQPVAKPLPGFVADRGDGWRHEQLSAAYVSAATSEDPLATVVCAAHHGVGRVLFDRDAHALLDGWTDCPEEVVVQAHRLFGPFGRYEVERDQAEREWGVHGVAHLEALLRCADMQVSREGR